MLNQSLIPSFEDVKLHKADLVASDVMNKLSGELNVVKNLSNAQECDSKYLPYLAFGDKVDFWDESLRDQDKRALIKASPKLHKLKGTRWAILEVLKAVGLSVPGYEAVIVEYQNRNDYKYNVQRDGTNSYNELTKHNHDLFIYDFRLKNWAEFAVLVKVQISQSQILKAKKLIKEYAPVRCILNGFICEVKQRDGAIFYSSTYTH